MILDRALSCLTKLSQKDYAEFAIIGFAVFAAKLSLFLLYHRLFGPNRVLKSLVCVGIIFSAALYSLNLILSSIYCAPHVGLPWGYATTHCVKLLPFGAIQGSLNVVLDLFLLWLPLPVIWNLNMPPRRKMGILAIFMTDFL